MRGRCVAEKQIPHCVRDDSCGSGEMFPATVPALKSSHDPSAPRLALMERAREKASRCARDDSGVRGGMGGHIGTKRPAREPPAGLAKVPAGAPKSLPPLGVPDDPHAPSRRL